MTHRTTARGLSKGSRIRVRATKARRRMCGTVVEIVGDAVRGPYVRFRDDYCGSLFLAPVFEVKAL